MSIRLTGQLSAPANNTPAANAEIRFISLDGTGNVPKGAISIESVGSDGSYDFPLEFGRFSVEIKQSERFVKQGAVSVNAETPSPLDIGELLEYTEPLTPGQIIYVEQLTDQAEASAQSASSSQSAAASSAAQAKSSADTAKLEADRAKQITGLDTVEEAVDFALDARNLGAPTAAEFFAQAEQRKRDNAGSGALEWGKHFDSTVSGYNPINQGLWSHTTANTLMWGIGADPTVSIDGVSRTNSPIMLVNGVKHKIRNVNRLDGNRANALLFPGVEQGTRSFNSATGEVIDYLTDVDPKYGDVAADLNEAVSRNFEGEYENGDCRLGSVGWQANPNLQFTTDGIKCDGTNTSNQYVSNDGAGSLEDGVEYEMSITVSEITQGLVWMTVGGGSLRSEKWGDAGTYTWRFTADTSTFTVVHPVVLGTGTIATLTNLSLRKVTDQPILSCQDFCFLESFHEDITESDIFCPLGNVHYRPAGATSENGTPLVDITGLGIAQGYCAFGEWDTTTKGKGQRWSTMTLTQREAELADPYNNLYVDGDKLIQVKYRVRVAKGLGDEWFGSRLRDGGSALRYGITGNTYISCQGKRDVSYDYTTSGSTFYPTHNSVAEPTVVDGSQQSVFCQKKVKGDQYAYKGLCFALPIALVQRGNSGAHDPVVNPDGYARWRHETQLTQDWYSLQAGNRPYSPRDAFLEQGGDEATIRLGKNVSTGGLANSSNGRDDQYSAYDAIYAGQVHDLRLPATKQDTSRALNDSIHKDVAGTKRGKGKLVHSTVYDDAGSGSNANAAQKWGKFIGGLNLYVEPGNSGVKEGDWIYLCDVTDGIIIRFKAETVVSGTGDFVQVDTTNVHSYEVIEGVVNDGDNGTGNEVYYIVEKELSPEYDDLPWVDFAGDLPRVKATFPNGVVGKWIPYIPDGTNPPLPLNRKCETMHFSVQTIDDGVTWNTSTTIVDEVKNETTNANTSTARVWLFYYSSLADFTEPSANPVVHGELGGVYSFLDNRVSVGNRLMPSLVGEVGKYPNWGSNNMFYALQSYRTYTEFTGALHFANHQPLQLRDTQNDSNAMKVTYGLTVKDGLIYPVYWGRELVHNGTDWGDAVDATLVTNAYGEIPINDNDFTVTDLNGVSCKAFCHISLEPIGIADETQGAK